MSAIRPRFGPAAWLAALVLVTAGFPGGGQTPAASQALAASQAPAAAQTPAAGRAPAASQAPAAVRAPATSQENGSVEPEGRFHQGNELYRAGDYAGALDAYLALFEEGTVSGSLYYNIGNAYFKAGDLGRAILFYERAKAELPGDEDVRANLELARSLAPDQIAPLPGFWLSNVASWCLRIIPRAWLILIVAAGYLVLAGALLYGLLASRPRLPTGQVARVAAAITLIFAANLAIREFGIGRPDRGVMIESEAEVQSAPSDDPSLHLFTIREGTVVRIDRRSDEWLEVVLEDGKVGWVRAGKVEPI